MTTSPTDRNNELSTSILLRLKTIKKYFFLLPTDEFFTNKKKEDLVDKHLSYKVVIESAHFMKRPFFVNATFCDEQMQVGWKLMRSSKIWIAAIIPGVSSLFVTALRYTNIKISFLCLPQIDLRILALIITLLLNLLFLPFLYFSFQNFFDFISAKRGVVNQLSFLSHFAIFF